MNRFLLSACVIVLSVLMFSCDTSNKSDKSAAQPAPAEVNELPYLSFTDLEKGPVSTRSLPGSSIIILFNSDCDHCQHEAEEIHEKIDFFKGYQLYFIASDSIHRIREFGEKYGLADKTNIHFGRADYQDVYRNFGSIPTPSIYIYSRERKFVKSFLGQTHVEEIAKFL